MGSSHEGLRPQGPTPESPVSISVTIVALALTNATMVASTTQPAESTKIIATGSLLSLTPVNIVLSTAPATAISSRPLLGLTVRRVLRWVAGDIEEPDGGASTGWALGKVTCHLMGVLANGINACLLEVDAHLSQPLTVCLDRGLHVPVAVG